VIKGRLHQQNLIANLVKCLLNLTCYPVAPTQPSHTYLSRNLSVHITVMSPVIG